MNVAKLLKQAAETFEQRNNVYGDTYKNVGPILLALFNGYIPSAITPLDARKMFLIVHLADKLARYCVCLDSRGGHLDSAHDMIVYAAMLEEATHEDAVLVATGLDAHGGPPAPDSKGRGAEA